MNILEEAEYVFSAFIIGTEIHKKIKRRLNAIELIEVKPNVFSMQDEQKRIK